MGASCSATCTFAGNSGHLEGLEPLSETEAVDIAKLAALSLDCSFISVTFSGSSVASWVQQAELGLAGAKAPDCGSELRIGATGEAANKAVLWLLVATMLLAAGCYWLLVATGSGIPFMAISMRRPGCPGPISGSTPVTEPTFSD